MTGVPRPVVAWLRDGNELKKGKRILLEEENVPEGVKYKMTIRDIVMKDFGKVRMQSSLFPVDLKSNYNPQHCFLDCIESHKHGGREGVQCCVPNHPDQAHCHC